TCPSLKHKRVSPLCFDTQQRWICCNRGRAVRDRALARSRVDRATQVYLDANLELKQGFSTRLHHPMESLGGIDPTTISCFSQIHMTPMSRPPSHLHR